MADLPTGWTETNLGEVVELKRGYDLPKRLREEGEVPIISSSGLSGTHNESKVDGPGVVTGRYGTIGELHWVDEDYWPLNTALYVRDFKGNDRKFIYYFLQTIDYFSYSDKAAVPGVNRNHLHKAEVCVPPLPEQRAIASILKALDDKIELNRRMNATLESLARAIFKSWFVDFDPVHVNAGLALTGQMPASSAIPTTHDPKVLELFPSTFQDSELGPIPEGWSTCVFDDFIDFVIGGDWGKETLRDDFVEEVRCIRGADIPDLQEGGVGKMPTRFIKSNSLKKRSLLAGNLAFEISGGSPTQSTGRPVLITQTFLDRIPTPVTCSNFCRFIRLKETVSPFYVYTMLRWLYDRDEFLQYENGTTGIKNLAFKLFASTHELLAPPERLMAEFDRVAGGYFEMIARHGAESQRLAKLRDALLPQLLSGELPVPEALTQAEEVPA